MVVSKHARVCVCVCVCVRVSVRETDRQKQKEQDMPVQNETSVLTGVYWRTVLV